MRLASSGPTVHQRAMAGIAFLDKAEPGWRSRVNVGALNIQYDCGCVIGQVFGSYNTQRKRLFAAGSGASPVALGFLAASHGEAGEKDEYAALTAAWKSILTDEQQTREFMTKTRIADRRRAVAA